MSLRKSPPARPHCWHRIGLMRRSPPSRAPRRVRTGWRSEPSATESTRRISFLPWASPAEPWMSTGGLYQALYGALLPDTTDEKLKDLLQRTTLEVWAMKRALTRWAASPAERESWFTQTNGVCPAPEQFVIRRPGWRVRISLWVRWGRGPGPPPLVGDGCWLEGAAGEAARSGDGHRLDGASTAGLLQAGRGPGGNGATGSLQTKAGMCKKTKG